MKISKRAIKADEILDETLEVVDDVPVVEEIIEEDPATSLQEPCAFDVCIDYIHQAIDCLADCAQAGDEKAKEAIANLSVVLLDLQ